MSERSIVTQGERLDAPAGIALRCLVIREALQRHSPLTWIELVDALETGLACLEQKRPPDTPIADDLRTLQAGGWIEQLPNDPESFRVAASIRADT